MASLEFQSMITMTKVQVSELAVTTVMSAMRACGLSGYRNDTEFSIGRHLRDVLSAPIMINNDRILANLATDHIDDSAARVDQRLKHRHARRHDHAATARRMTPGPLAHLNSALFQPMGVDGVYARTALYLAVRDGLEAYITRLREPQVEVMRFPPVMSRSQLEKSGYLKSFPNLLGCVCALHGAEASIRGAAERLDSGGDWTTSLTAADLVLSPAACYPVYPIVATPRPLAGRRAAVRHRGRLFPARALAQPRPAAVVSDARIRAHRQPRRNRRNFASGGWTSAQGIAGDLGLPFTIDVGERSVLRPRRPDHGGQPAPASAQIRAA